jgi:transposase
MFGSAAGRAVAGWDAMMLLTPRDPADPARLDALIAAERAAVQRDRLRAVRLSLDGREAADVAAAVGRSRTFVQTWAYRYRDGGLAALAARKQPGRRPKLTPAQRAAVRARVLAGPAAADGGVCALRGEDVRRILAREFGVPHSLAAVYDLLRRLRLSPLRPRPRHRKSDPAAADAWLAAAPLLSGPGGPPGPPGGSRSGSRTRPGSGNRGR